MCVLHLLTLANCIPEAGFRGYVFGIILRQNILAAGKVVQVFPDVFPTKYGWFTRLGSCPVCVCVSAALICDSRNYSDILAFSVSCWLVFKKGVFRIMASFRR